MSLDGCYENEMGLLEEQLANGEITITEYNKYVRDVERDYRDYSRQGN